MGHVVPATQTLETLPFWAYKEQRSIPKDPVTKDPATQAREEA